MSTESEILLEEFQVLESIFPTELSTKLRVHCKGQSETQISIEVEPDDSFDVKLALNVNYVEGYPDVLPDLSLEIVEGEVNDEEVVALLDDLRVIGQGNLGMAMTFTLVSHLREQLSVLIHSRTERQRRADSEKERLALEAEEARMRGTAVTVESFRAWKTKFDTELTMRRAREDEEKMKGLMPKEKEEFKRIGMRLTGRQLFERNRNLEEDGLMEEGTMSVDISQYERTCTSAEEVEEDRVTFSDSD